MLIDVQVFFSLDLNGSYVLLYLAMRKLTEPESAPNISTAQHSTYLFAASGGGYRFLQVVTYRKTDFSLSLGNYNVNRCHADVPWSK
jgi:hypothetical protein